MELKLPENKAFDLKKIFSSKNSEIAKERVLKEYLTEIYHLETQIFGESAYKKEQIEEMYFNDNYSFYLYCDENSKILGYIILYDSLDSLEIMKIAVNKSFRNKNIATTLIEEVVKNSSSNILLEVRESNNAAINFYIKNGFKKISIRKNYYINNNENAVIMLFER